MKQLSIIIADSDESFAEKIQERLEKELGDSADITIITSMRFLADFFSTPKSADVILIDKGLFFSDIERHSIKNICILTDNPNDCLAKYNEYTEYVYRFSSLKDITSKLISSINITDELKKEGCSALLVTSPAGGCGKTITALAVSQALKKSGKKVLYIDTSNMQTSSFWLKYSKTLKTDFDIADNLSPDSIFETVVKGEFDYVVPMKATLGYVGESNSEIDFASIVSKIKSKNCYDWIVVDTSADCGKETASLISCSDVVLVMMLQDRFSISKINKFLSTVDCSDYDKYKLVCSHYMENTKNYFEELPDDFKSPITIPYMNVSEAKNLNVIAEINAYRHIAALLS